MKGKGGRRAHRVRGKEHCKVHKAEGPRRAIGLIV